MIDFCEINPIENLKIYDTHAHYDDERFDNCLDELMCEMQNKGVGRIINCGCDLESGKKCLDLAEKYPFVYSAVGIHPSNIGDTAITDIENLSKHQKCVAIGEIGLDYYWVSDNKEQQKKIFLSQIEIAKRLNLPIIVHDRDAHADTLEILKATKPKGVVHSISGSMDMAEDILKLGMYLGIGGVITFKNAKKLPEVVEMLPLDRLLLETVAPYLTPVPFRSKTNHSQMIYLTAQKIAEIKTKNMQEILEISYSNAQNLFGV